MNSGKRGKVIEFAMDFTRVSLEQVDREALLVAAGLCDHFQLPFGTVIRRALAIAHVDGIELSIEAVQEAVQHHVMHTD